MNEQALRFRLGIFVLGALLLLAVLVMLFGGFPQYFKRAEAFTLVFTNAQGVAPGTPVRRSGVRIGEVRAVVLDNDTGKVAVTIQVEEGFTLRRCDRATLVHGLLTSDTAVAFLPPREDEKDIDTRPVDPGSTLEGQAQADAGALMQKTSDLMPPAQEALVEIKKVFQRFDKLTPVIEDALKEFRAVGKTTREMVPELRKTNDEIHAMVKSVRLAIPDLKKTSDEAQITARAWGKLGERLDILVQTNEDRFTKTIERLQDALKRVADLFSDENQRQFQGILKNVRASSERLDGIARVTEDLLKDSRDTVKRVNDSLARSDDVLANMQKATKPLAERSQAILKNVDESTDKLNRILGDLHELLRALTRGEGSLQKLLTEPGLYNNLNDTAQMVTRILPRVDRILRDMEIFADKLARHPESLGLGGVVRPGSGLKEAPSGIRILPGH